MMDYIRTRAEIFVCGNCLNVSGLRNVRYFAIEINLCEILGLFLSLLSQSRLQLGCDTLKVKPGLTKPCPHNFNT